MTMARSSVVPADGAGVFHCVSRCVRRAWLWGVDPSSGQDFSHRKQWVRDRLEELAGIFSVEVFAYAVMSNHLHVVLRMRPESTAAWSHREVVERWRRLFPWQRDINGRAVPPTDQQLQTWLADAKKVAQWRQRLGDLSWLMRCLKEPLARRSNQEDQCTGRFWEGRFKCQNLCDMGAVLACMAYVDLNPVRAGLVQAPELSEFTSVRERFDAEVARRGSEGKTRAVQTEEVMAGQAAASASAAAENRPDPIKAAAWLAPLERIAVTEHPSHCAVTLEQYLELIEATGRILVADKGGSIPRHLVSVLERLELNAGHWADTVEGYRDLFQRLAGSKARLVERAKLMGRQWFCRGADAPQVYRTECGTAA